MMFGASQSEKPEKPAESATEDFTFWNRKGAKPMKLHSIAGVLRGRAFEGTFNIGAMVYAFSYRPQRAAIRERQLDLIGDLTVIDQRPNARVQPRHLRGIRATLVATQGGIGTPPPREKQPPDVYTAAANLPAVESSGSLSFSGALYFKLAPLNARALGVPADFSHVQLNVRLAPRNDAERRLQAAYSSMVDALYGKAPNEEAAAAALRDINKLIAG